MGGWEGGATGYMYQLVKWKECTHQWFRTWMN